MFRIAVIALVAVGGLIALLFYVTSPASDRAEQQRDIMEDGGKGMARRVPRGKVHIPTNRPRGAKHVLLKIAFPPSDPRAVLGGDTVLILRGNGVVHRRAGLGTTSLERHVIAAKVVDAALTTALDLPEKGDGFAITIDTGKGPVVRKAGAEAIAGLLAKLHNSGTPWVPSKVHLAIAKAARSDDLPEWPSLPSFGDFATYATGATYGGTERVIKRLLTALAESDHFRDGDVAWRVTAWSPLFE